MQAKTVRSLLNAAPIDSKATGAAFKDAWDLDDVVHPSDPTHDPDDGSGRYRHASRHGLAL